MAQNKNIKSHLSSANQTILELEGQVRQLESELAQSRSQIMLLTDNDLKYYKDKLQKSVNDVANLQGQLYQKEADLEKSQTEVSSLQQKLELARRENCDWEKERGDRKSVV